MPLDIARLLEPVAAEAPCGEDLRYAAAELRDQAKGATRPQYVDGREEVVVVPPDWRQLERDALALAARGKDLRLWVVLARATLQRDGLPGLVAGLRLIADGLDRYWPDLHPALDLEETDPEQQAFERRNALNLLADPDGLLAELQRVPLLRARGYGQFSLRAMRLASGELRPAAGEEAPDPKIVQAAIGEAQPDEAAERDAVRAAAAEIPGLAERIGAVFVARTGSKEAAPGLDELVRFAQEVLRRLPGPAAGVVEDPPPVTPAPNGQAGEPMPAPASVPPHAPRQGVGGREDVIRMLDQILDYYRQREPSSPVPLLLRRARRLVPMSFVEAMRELAPSGVDDLARAAGQLEDSGT